MEVAGGRARLREAGYLDPGLVPRQQSTCLALLFLILDRRLSSDTYSAMSDVLKGNATPEQKELLIWWSKHFGLQGKGFADNIADRMRWVEADVVPMENGGRRLQARLVHEITVEEGVSWSPPYFRTPTVLTEHAKTWRRGSVSCMEHVRPCS